MSIESALKELINTSKWTIDCNSDTINIEGECPLTQHSTWSEGQVLSTPQLVEAYLESRRGGISEGSLTSYRHALNVFSKHCPVLPTQPEELERYLARFTERRSAAAVYTPINLLYGFAQKRYGIPNIMNLVQRPRFKPKEVVSLSLAEAKAVLDSCRNSRETALVHLYMGHGLRLEEGVRMNVGDVGDGQILVRGKMRTEFMPLLPETKIVLLELAGNRGPDKPIFMSRQHNRLHTKQSYNTVKGILERAGVLEGKPSDARIASHTLRKSFATLAYHAGCDGRVIERLLRHMKRDATSLYVGMPMNHLQRYLEKYSPIRLINGHLDTRVAENIT